MLKPVIDADLCTGCENCVSLCPEVFEFQGTQSVVAHPELCDQCECQEAANECPVEAITME